MNRSFFAIGIVVFAGCATVKESGEESTSASRLREFEASFRPSDHDQPLKDFFPEVVTGRQRDSVPSSTIANPQSGELAQGYRVQIYATSSFDDATQTKAIVEEQFADEWFYIVYDAPTYKLRGGNFLERYEADLFAKLLGEKGYRSSWVVPERVYRNPPPRSAPPQDLQK